MVAGNLELLISGPFKQNKENKINNNVYYLHSGKKETRWIWEGKEITGFSAYKKKSLQDRNSVFRKPKFADESKRDLRLSIKTQ